MSGSPRPEVMALENLIHERRSSIMDTTYHVPPPPPLQTHHLPHIRTDSLFDRASSPHGSDTSRYSSSGQGSGFESLHGPRSRFDQLHAMHFHSPPIGHSPVGYAHDKLPGGVMLPSIIPPDMSHHTSQYGEDDHLEMAQHQQTRTYPCRTCEKGFSRRSDLARHGKHLDTSWPPHCSVFSC